MKDVSELVERMAKENERLWYQGDYPEVFTEMAESNIILISEFINDFECEYEIPTITLGGLRLKEAIQEALKVSNGTSKDGNEERP